jgi:protocadherin delta 1
MACFFIWTFQSCVFTAVFFSLIGWNSAAREFRYTLIEELQPGTFIGNVVEDARLQQKYRPSEFRQLRFRFLNEPPVNFIVENTTGVIRTGSRIDRESVCPGRDDCRIKLDVAVQPVQYFRIIKVTVKIIDINDNWPEFPEPEITHQILESALPGSGFTLPAAIDLDSPTFGIQRYELHSESDKFMLKVTNKVDGSTDVRLILEHPLDRETQNVYTLRVRAYDGGEPARAGSVDITIRVLDANDNDPVFDNSTYDVTILENIPKHRTIIQVHARDSDTGLYGKIRYGFSSRTTSNFGHLFGIDAITGDIFIIGSIDFETASVYHLAVTARDYGPDSLPADATVIIHVKDVNDHAPEIIVNTLAASGTSSAEIFEDADSGTFVAHISVQDKDAGRNGIVNCSLSDNHFELQKLYETEFKIVTTATLDREMMSQYNLALVCKDSGSEPQMSIKHIKVIVRDVNDNAPVFSHVKYTADLIENNYEGAFVVQVNATDRDIGRNAEIRYSLPKDMVEYFYVNDITGRITAKRSFDHEVMSRVTFSIIASDQGKSSLSSSAIVDVTIQDVNDEPPVLSESSYSFGIYENSVAGAVVGTVKATDADDSPYNEFYFSLLPSRSNTDDFKIDPQTGKITTAKVLDRESYSVYHIVVCACSKGSPPLSTTATVNVFIADKNDNAPSLDYPTNYNNTIYLSNRAPVGYVVTRVRAHDVDIGSNAKLSYRFSKGNEDGVFSIDPNLGVVTLNVDIANIDHELYELAVMVRDHGVPERYVIANLNIVVNKSVDFPIAQASLLSRHNVTIVISLACVSALITVILVIVIIVIRRQDRAKKNHKYNCRMEALKMLTARETVKDASDDNLSSSVSSSSLKDLPNGNCHMQTNGDKPKKEVSFSADVENGTASYDKGRHMWPSLIDQQTLQVHQLLAMLKREHDDDSAYSGDGSNADSGRGGSDEGDGAPSRGPSNRQVHGLFFGGRDRRPSPSARNDSFGNSSNQIVPEMSNISVSNMTDLSDQRPATFQTFATRQSPRQHPKVYYDRRGTNVAPSGVSSVNLPRHQHELPRQVDASVCQSSCCESRPYSRCGTESSYADTDCGMQYSCADMSDALHTKTPSRFDDKETDDTATSRSYVVDPHELCNEIDELFFRDMLV